MTLEELRENPIIKIFREEGLSYLHTKERIDKEWDLPPGGYPITKIMATTDIYMEQLRYHIQRFKSKNRFRKSTPKYLYNNLKGLTKSECKVFGEY